MSFQRSREFYATKKCQEPRYEIMFEKKVLCLGLVLLLPPGLLKFSRSLFFSSYKEGFIFLV